MTENLQEKQNEFLDETEGSAISPTNGKGNFDKAHTVLGFYLKGLTTSLLYKDSVKQSVTIKSKTKQTKHPPLS